MPGMKQHCIVTTELEDTLAKSRGETSGVLTAMQHYYDHNKKEYADSRTGRIHRINCRLSWLAALPVGDKEIDTDKFRQAFGENTSHGMIDRMIFGFSEEKFDGRRSRKWCVPHGFNHFEVPLTKAEMAIMGEDNKSGLIVSGTRVAPLWRILNEAVVDGFAEGVEDMYLNWEGEGRDTWAILKVMVLLAILHGHDKIERSDYDFAAAFMAWQVRIRAAFSAGRAKNVRPAEFNEVVVKQLESRVSRWKKTGKPSRNERIGKTPQGKDRLYVQWKQVARDNRWYRFGMDVEKTMTTLQKSGTIDWLYVKDAENKPEANPNWICLCQITEGS